MYCKYKIDFYTWSMIYHFNNIKRKVAGCWIFTTLFNYFQNIIWTTKIKIYNIFMPANITHRPKRSHHDIFVEVSVVIINIRVTKLNTEWRNQVNRISNNNLLVTIKCLLPINSLFTYRHRVTRSKMNEFNPYVALCHELCDTATYLTKYIVSKWHVFKLIFA